MQNNCWRLRKPFSKNNVYPTSIYVHSTFMHSLKFSSITFEYISWTLPEIRYGKKYLRRKNICFLLSIFLLSYHRSSLTCHTIQEINIFAYTSLSCERNRFDEWRCCESTQITHHNNNHIKWNISNMSTQGLSVNVKCLDIGLNDVWKYIRMETRRYFVQRLLDSRFPILSL